MSPTTNPSKTNNPSNEPTRAQPMQIGTTLGETEDLIDEIGHPGVADSTVQVEEMRFS